MKRLLETLLVLGVAGCGAKESTDNTSRPVIDVKIGDRVPDFEVTINGKKWTLSQLCQQPEMTGNGTVVMTFWCSFCHSCRDVEHALDKLAKTYQGKAGVFALDASAGETAEGVAQFARDQGLTLPIAINAGGSTASIFGVQVTTTTVIIDSRGILRYCGQFADRQHAYAENALNEVLAGDEVTVKQTRHKG